MAVALNDSRYSLFVVLKAIVFILLCPPSISPAPHKLLLDSSLKPRHFSLLVGREFTGVRLWES